MLVSFGPFAFDRQRRLLRRGDAELPLPPRVLAVLELLVTRAGDIVPRQELLDSVWREAFVTDTSLAEAVSFLRHTLGDDPAAPTYIQTVHRRSIALSPPSQARQRRSPTVRPIRPSFGHPITTSLDRPIATSPDRPIATSPGRPIIRWLHLRRSAVSWCHGERH